jgi:Tfp pilus assembly pilus retraction ATPase PilT
VRNLLPVLLAAVLAPTPLLAQDSTQPPAPRSVRRIQDRITYEEIQTLPDARDAYELVRALRPHFLHERNTGSAGRSRPGQLMVYVNNAERGTLETLRTIPRHAVLEIRKLSAADATTKYGKDQNGVILVTVITSAPR